MPKALCTMAYRSWRKLLQADRLFVTVSRPIKQETSPNAEKPARRHVASRSITVCEIFAFELQGDLETEVGSLKVIKSATIR